MLFSIAVSGIMMVAEHFLKNLFQVVSNIFLEKGYWIFVFQFFKLPKIWLDYKLLILGENLMSFENLWVEQIAVDKIFDVDISIDHHEQGFIEAVMELIFVFWKLKNTLNEWLNAENGILSKGSFDGVIPGDIILVHVHSKLAILLLRIFLSQIVMHYVFDLVVHYVNKSFIYLIYIRLNYVDVKW